MISQSRNAKTKNEQPEEHIHMVDVLERGLKNLLRLLQFWEQAHSSADVSLPSAARGPKPF